MGIFRCVQRRKVDATASKEVNKLNIRYCALIFIAAESVRKDGQSVMYLCTPAAIRRLGS